MHDSYLLRLFVFNQPEKCFQKGRELNVIGAFAGITNLTKLN